MFGCCCQSPPATPAIKKVILIGGMSGFAPFISTVGSGNAENLPYYDDVNGVWKLPDDTVVSAPDGYGEDGKPTRAYRKLTLKRLAASGDYYQMVVTMAGDKPYIDSIVESGLSPVDLHNDAAQWFCDHLNAVRQSSSVGADVDIRTTSTSYANGGMDQPAQTATSSSRKYFGYITASLDWVNDSNVSQGATQTDYRLTGDSVDISLIYFTDTLTLEDEFAPDTADVCDGLATKMDSFDPDDIPWFNEGCASGYASGRFFNCRAFTIDENGDFEAISGTWTNTRFQHDEPEDNTTADADPLFFRRPRYDTLLYTEKRALNRGMDRSFSVDYGVVDKHGCAGGDGSNFSQYCIPCFSPRFPCIHDSTGWNPDEWVEDDILNESPPYWTNGFDRITDDEQPTVMQGQISRVWFDRVTTFCLVERDDYTVLPTNDAVLHKDEREWGGAFYMPTADDAVTYPTKTIHDCDNDVKVDPSKNEYVAEPTLPGHVDLIYLQSLCPYQNVGTEAFDMADGKYTGIYFGPGWMYDGYLEPETSEWTFDELVGPPDCCDPA